MGFDLTELRADTDSIISDWTETVNFQRATSAVATGAGGEVTLTWSTNLATGCDVQPINPRAMPRIGVGGVQFMPEVQVVLRYGSDVQVGDRFSFDGALQYIRHVRNDEDKVIAWASRRTRDDG